MPLSKSTPPMTPTSDDGSERSGRDEPVVWYAFYSEAAGREYYFEPKSKTATWIMPDDYNPHPKNESQKEVVRPKLRRKVSFGANDKSVSGSWRSLIRGGESHVRKLRTGRVGTDAKKKNAALLVVPCKSVAITAVLALSSVAYLYQTGPILTYTSLGTQVQVSKAMKKEEVFVSKDTAVKVVSLTSTEDVRNDEREQVGMEHSFRPATDESNGKNQKTSALPPKDELSTDLLSQPLVQTRSIKETDETAPKPEKETRQTLPELRIDQHVQVEEIGAPPIKCTVPFSHVFSAECRKRSALFDAEVATLSWLM